jgi:hypothetical protein
VLRLWKSSGFGSALTCVIHGNRSGVDMVVFRSGPRILLTRDNFEPRREISLPLFDVSADLDPKAVAEAWMKADLAEPVDLLCCPLFSFALFK